MIRTRGRIAAVETIKRQIVDEVRYDFCFQAEVRGAPVTQAEFAAQVDLTQAEMSELLAGKVKRFTIDRLLMVLIALGHTPTVSVC